MDCPRAVVDRLVAQQDLLVTLRHDPRAQVVDAVQRFGRSRAAVQRERGNCGVVVAVGSDNVPDGQCQ